MCEVSFRKVFFASSPQDNKDNTTCASQEAIKYVDGLLIQSLLGDWVKLECQRSSYDMTLLFSSHLRERKAELAPLYVSRPGGGDIQ